MIDENNQSQPGNHSENLSTSNRAVNYPVYDYEDVFRHMTKTRNQKEQALYMITDEVLFNVWDALCLSIDDEFREEYLFYLPNVFDLLISTDNGSELYKYLVFVEESDFGASKDDFLVKRRADNVANILMDYKKSLFEGAAMPLEELQFEIEQTESPATAISDNY